ncbi:MAG: hypothetical protein U0930_24185 [Pirellulales bacterium]
MKIARSGIVTSLIAIVWWSYQEPLTTIVMLREKKPDIGVVIFLETGANLDRSSQIKYHLHFCVFENGKNDSIYIGTRRGGWYNGQFDLNQNSNIVATVKVPDLTSGGVIIPLGDLLDEIPQNNGGIGGPTVYVSNVRGVVK